MDSKKKIKEICDGFETSEAGKFVRDMAKANRPPVPVSYAMEFEVAHAKKRSCPYKAGWFSQFKAVFWRSFISVLREPAILKVKAFQTVVSLPIAIVQIESRMTKQMTSKAILIG